MADSVSSGLDQLRRENARLIELLEAHGIAWRFSEPAPTEPAPFAEADPAKGPSSTQEKVALFRRLFRGRDDVYALRWQSSSGRSGYAPACANEWRPGLCEKPRISCRDCNHRELQPLSDGAIYGHLAGEHTVGLYPLLENDHCHLLAIDFDEQDWRDDARAFLRSCRQLAVPAALEISRSGEGAHAWVFFEEAVAAREARQLGAALISHTCKATRQLQLSSYDRLFPNQDTLPKGGFGNLIALPLQKKARQQGCSVFVDTNLQPYPDQWVYLASLQRLSLTALQTVIQNATGGGHPLDLAFIDEEDLATPWKQRPAPTKLSGPLPASLNLTLADRLYVERSELPQPLLNRLIRLAAFANPAFYKAQAMRLSVWDKPRVIGCAETFPQHIALPRGCLEPVQTLLRDQGIGWELVDERQLGSPLELVFTGQLRDDQEAAVEAMLRHDIGVLQAPTAFGKTVVAAAILARRGVNTLVLVIAPSCCANGKSGSTPFWMSLLRRSVASVEAKPSPPANSTSP